MGLGLGIGLLGGARVTAVSTLAVLVLIVAALALLIVILPVILRPVLLCVLAGACAGWLCSQVTLDETSDMTAELPGREFTGFISSDPRLSRSGSHAPVRWSDAAGQTYQARVFFGVAPDIGRGDRVTVVGTAVHDPEEVRVFAEHVTLSKRAPSVELARRSVREYASQAMVSHVSGSAGSLTLGLLIGDDTGLAARERGELRASGLAHITAVSGWNVSILVVTVGAVFRAFGARRWRWVLVQLALLGGYVWIVGPEAPIVRAAIMGAVALTALLVGRPSHFLTHLTLTAGVMAVLDPAIIESLSFQLSFMAMLGLAVATRLTSDLEGWQRLLATPALSASMAGLATAPLLAATFGTLSLMTVPANLLAGPLVPFATFGGMSVVASSWLWPVADAAGWVTWCLGTFILKVSSTFANVPGGYHQFAPLSSTAAILLYAALGLLAAPLFPETRPAARRVEAWLTLEPGLAFAAAGIVVVVVSLGAVIAQ